jgi:RND family efflux transporter MFP subunit
MVPRSNSLLIFMLAFLAGLLVSCSKEESSPELIVRPVRYMQVYSSGGRQVRTFSGVAQAVVESKLSFKVAGTIKRIAVDVGDQIEAGQLIAELDDADFSLQVQEAEASLAQAQAQERNASASYERVRNLYANRNASKQDLDQARSAYESAVAMVESMEKRLELARRRLGYAQLKAPVGGSIASSRVEINENVQAGQTIVLLTSGSDIEVKVGIPEVLITGVEEGSAVTVTIDALPGREFSGRVTEVGVATTEMATTYPVTVRLDRSDQDIRSGMAAMVAFEFEARGPSGRFHIPPVAVREDREGRFLFVVTPADPGFGVTHRRPVKVGELTDKGLEVLEGLSDGELVVIAGVSRIRDGLKVKLLEIAGSQR